MRKEEKYLKRKETEQKGTQGRNTRKGKMSWREWMAAGVCMAVAALSNAETALAGSVAGTPILATTTTGIPEIDNLLSTLKMLFLGVVAGIGLVILIKGIGDTAQAYQQADSHGMYDGAKGIVAGAIMVFAGAILTIMGL